MRVACIGGGPGGLYFAILTKMRDPTADVVVYERNRADDTFGFGVVFSDQTLSTLGDVDPASYREITERFHHWDAIDIHYRGEIIRSKGHGFSGLSRMALLDILQRRAAELGVRLAFSTDVAPEDPRLEGVDLIVVGDGIQSGFRTHYAADFVPSITTRKARFVWLGTTFPYDAFTFYFREAEAGLFQVHAYRYEAERSTFIVECSEEAFSRTGLGEADEAATARYFEGVFAAELQGHALLVNRSIWRKFPVVRNARWHRQNMVLVGDAARSAHFSIGSGTKLALEDAIALRAALDRGGSVAQCLAAYESERRPPSESVQRAAQVSLEWFEQTERHVKKPPLTFAFALLTRSLRVTHDNLRLRDPALMDRVDRDFEAEATGAPAPSPPRRPTPPMFVPLRLRELTLPNRVGVSPMCMYSAEDGTIDDFHFVHLASRAIGGAGLVMTEMTNVSAEGRITPGCAGMYDARHVTAWRRVVDFIHRHATGKVGLQIGHAGRKGSTLAPWEGQDVPLPEGGWDLIGPSALPWAPNNPMPRAMDAADMERVLGEFVRATHLALEAGFDLIELHAAHGYLLATFLSPLTNRRTDEYGGGIENRARFPLEVFRAMRAAWPAERPMSVRLSASDWAPGGTTEADLVATARLFGEAGCDLVDVSSGSTVALQRPEYGRLYQVPFAELVKSEVGVATAAVGNISSFTDVNGVIAARRADLCFLARAHLFDPYWVRHAATAQEYDLPWPKPYGILRGYNPRL